MPQPKLTIGVPVYNTAEYLEKCLVSICNQTLREIEIIAAVDDRCDDSSLHIAKRLASANSRIIVIPHSRHTLSGARNVTLERATGQYIGFVDSDDWIAPDMFESMYNAAVADGLDITVCGVYRVENGQKQPLVSYAGRQSHVDKTGLRDFLYLWLFSSQATMVCNKIYRLGLLRAQNIRFDEAVRYNEDAFFNTLAFAHAASAGSVCTMGYHYLQRPSSIIHHTRLDAQMQVHEQRWQQYIALAVDAPMKSTLPIAAIRLLSSILYNARQQQVPLDTTAAYIANLIEHLGLRPYLEQATGDTVLRPFAQALGMDEEAMESYRSLAQSLLGGAAAIKKRQEGFQ